MTARTCQYVADGVRCTTPLEYRAKNYCPTHANISRRASKQRYEVKRRAAQEAKNVMLPGL